MNNPLTKTAWSPYAVGAAIGVLSWFAFATADHPLGITSAFENTAALAGQAVAPSLEETHPYYVDKAKEGESPKIGWEWMLVVGVFVGALLSSLSSGDRTNLKVPPLWRSRFGEGTAKRFVVAFLGGAVMMFGARLAQGCTSGHGISGTLQLAASSWLFVAAMFAAAVATAFLLYGKEGANNV
ncbi:YeeE/YedE thiosulfate transporter family protein [Alienimonas chondri]|uniref:Sulphur transport domain-containing protein n=1 Tax=Alienimonas chondri TaxID=2681879 RepID=A0ABX1VGK5_9PLAN|nr:YeeE/YedE thiosulfate transporter family protein [Alienimonas chondri]NNJ25921.1 hypothetical protein [Alienimonas chondri]